MVPHCASFVFYRFLVIIFRNRIQMQIFSHSGIIIALFTVKQLAKALGSKYLWCKNL